MLDILVLEFLLTEVLGRLGAQLLRAAAATRGVLTSASLRVGAHWLSPLLGRRGGPAFRGAGPLRRGLERRPARRGLGGGGRGRLRLPHRREQRVLPLRFPFADVEDAAAPV